MTQAEFKLRQEGSDNCYLTCYCESTKVYILSVLERKPNSHTRIEHFEINMTRKNKHTLYEILGTQEKFRDIFVLLEHFEKNPVNHRISRIGTGITKHGDSRKSSKMSKAKQQAALRFHPYKDISTVSCSDPHFLSSLDSCSQNTNISYHHQLSMSSNNIAECALTVASDHTRMKLRSVIGTILSL